MMKGVWACLLAGCVLVSSVRLARRAFGATGWSDTIIRSAILALAEVVLGGMLLGSIGLLSTGPYAVFCAACFAASMFLRQSHGPALPALRLPIVIAAVLVPTLILVVAVGIIQSPLTLYDSLSYHLFFPARWVQAHQLSIIATPFSDEAQAYAPANGELFFAWLMVPFHSDILARIGQLPFYLLGGVILYALARRIGAAPAHAAYAAAFYFLAKPIVEQAVGADVDLICWSMFLASIYIGIKAIDNNRRRDWALWGISLGLYAGTKYVALVYLPVLVLLPLIRGLRLRALWALPGILVFAAPWYLRNWAVGGSPIYPSSLAVAGFTIAHGAYSRAAMMNSIFHLTSWRFLPVVLGHAFGTTLFLVWAPFAVIGGWRMVSSEPRWPKLFLLIAPVLMVPLHWLGVPDNVDSRFLMPVAILALLPLAVAFGTNRTWNSCVHGLFAVGLVWVVVGWHGQLPFDLPWPMTSWLTLEGVVAHAYVAPFIALASIAAGVAWLLSRQPGRAVLVMIVLIAAGSVTAAIGGNVWCLPDRCAPLQISPIYVRGTMVEGWKWASEHITKSTVAYTGNNVPYPLVGSQLSNVVRYVNIDRHVDWRFHDYDLAHRRHRDGPLPPGMLAVSSGVLKPLPESEPPRWQVDAVRPRYERMEGDREAWIQNLRSFGVDYLFVTTLSAYEIDFMSHNDSGMPVEDDWARADPAIFDVVYENSQVRVYALHLR